MSGEGWSLPVKACPHVRSRERPVRFLARVEPYRLLWCGDAVEMDALRGLVSEEVFTDAPTLELDAELRAFDDLPIGWSVGRFDESLPWALTSQAAEVGGPPAGFGVSACERVLAGSPVQIAVATHDRLHLMCGDEEDERVEPLSSERIAEIFADDNALLGLHLLPPRWTALRIIPETRWAIQPRRPHLEQCAHDPGPVGADGLDRVERKCVKNVEKFGWHAFAVTAGDADDGFSYTVGLFETFEHPELVVFGQNAKWQYAALRFLADEIRGGRRFAPGDTHDELLPGFVCRFRAVNAYASYRDKLGWVLWYFGTYRKRSGIVPVLQLVYPDRTGVYPDEPGYRTNTRQPLLP